MSNFSESHSLRTYKERRKAKSATKNTKMEKWLKADKTVDEVYVDLVNGFTRSDVIQKLKEGLYKPQEGKGITYRTAVDYVDAAMQRMAYDYEKDAEKLRADLCSKLTSVYQDAVEHNDRYNAINALQTLMKLTGIALDKQQNNIQVNANKEGISINFGFKKEEDNTDENQL